MNMRHEPRTEPGGLTAEQTDRLRRILVHSNHAAWSRTYDDKPCTVDGVLDVLDTLTFNYSRMRDDRDALLTRLTNEVETTARRTR